MPAPEAREALDVVTRLEAELVALQRAFAALDADAYPQLGEVGKGAPAPRADRAPPIAPEEHRRLTEHLDALLEEVRQLGDFLASDEADSDPAQAG